MLRAKDQLYVALSNFATVIWYPPESLDRNSTYTGLLMNCIISCRHEKALEHGMDILRTERDIFKANYRATKQPNSTLCHQNLNGAFIRILKETELGTLISLTRACHDLRHYTYNHLFGPLGSEVERLHLWQKQLHANKECHPTSGGLGPSLLQQQATTCSSTEGKQPFQSRTNVWNV
ncbi:hypothetical protein MHYP_G00071860 [Metynnis hypsauchen]